MATRSRLTFPAFALPAAALAAGLLATPVRAQDRTPAPGPRVEAQHRSPRRDAYVLSTGGEWMSSGVNFDHVDDFGRGGRGDFLWFRRGGRAFIVDEAETVRRANALFEPLRALEPEQEALHERETALDDRENKLDAEEESIDSAMERLEPDYEEGDEYDEDADAPAPPPPPVSAEDDHERDALEQRRAEIHEKQRALYAEQRAFEREERALDQREEGLEREAEAKLWKLVDELIASGAARPADGR